MKVLVQYRHIVGAQSILILVLFPSVLVRIGQFYCRNTVNFSSLIKLSLFLTHTTSLQVSRAFCSTYPLSNLFRMKEKYKCQSLSCVQVFAIPWTVACQASLSIGFSRQECWNRLSFLSLGIFPTQRSNPGLLDCRQTLYCLSHQGSPDSIFFHYIISASGQ